MSNEMIEQVCTDVKQENPSYAQSDAYVIRAALPLLMADPIYRNSSYAPRQTLDLMQITNKQLYNCIPTALRWNRRAQGSRAAVMLYQLERIQTVHGPLVTIVISLNGWPGGLYDSLTADHARRLVQAALGVDTSAVWKLEQGRSGHLHIHVWMAATALEHLTIQVQDVRPVHDLPGAASYGSKPAPAGACRKNHARHPDPYELAAVTLDYVHARSGGCLDQGDWDTLHDMRGYIVGEVERAMIEAGLLSRKLTPLKVPYSNLVDSGTVDSRSPCKTVKLSDSTDPATPTETATRSGATGAKRRSVGQISR